MINFEKVLNELQVLNLISSEQVEDIMRESSEGGKRPEKLLLEKKIVDIEEITKAKAKIMHLSYIDLTEKKIGEGVINTISSSVSENYKIICFDKNNVSLKIGIVDPDNFKAIGAVDYMAKENGLRAEYYLISEKSFNHVFKQYQSLAKELSSALKDKEEEEGVVELNEKEAIELDEVTKSAPVAKIVSVIIRHAIDGSASDIHIEPLSKETRIRYRIDGILHTSLILPRSVHSSIVARIKVMASLKLDETRIPQDGNIRLSINDRDIDFRVSILPLVNTEKVVMRILDTSKVPPTLTDLGFQGSQLEKINKNLDKTEGLILVVGPTGSGKSTTLFSLLNIYNKEGVNIVTLEDPVEYQMKGVNQSQIRPLIGYTFATGLRSFLRQDPDIIMVGEIRDTETAELAIHASLTGHLVLSTVHTNDAIGTINRLRDMHIESFLISSVLHTIISQRLARKICSHCKIKVDLPGEYKERIKKEIEKITIEYIDKSVNNFKGIENITAYRGKGCGRCGNTGYSGRVAISEVLDVNTGIKKIISEGKQISLDDVKANQKFLTVFQDGIIKILQGQTTIEEVLRVVRE